MTDKLKASMPGFPESCSSLQTFRTEKYSRNCVIFLSDFSELYQENGEWNLPREFDLEGQNSDVLENGMVWEVVWGTCRWVFKILELLTLLGCFCPFTEREWSRITSKRRAILARITSLNLFQISNASVGFWLKVRFIIIRYDCLISLGRGHGCTAALIFLHCFFQNFSIMWKLCCLRISIF